MTFGKETFLVKSISGLQPDESQGIILNEETHKTMISKQKLPFKILCDAEILHY